MKLNNKNGAKVLIKEFFNQNNKKRKNSTQLF